MYVKKVLSCLKRKQSRQFLFSKLANFFLFKVKEKLLQLHHHWLKNKRGFYFLNQLPSELHQEPLQGNPANNYINFFKEKSYFLFKKK